MSLVTDRQDIGGGEWGLGSAVFDPSREYRYALTRTWDPDLPTTAFVMLNPSTADAFIVDPTVRRCLGYARDWGSGSLLVLNAFGLRYTDPRALYSHRDPTGPDNDEVILSMLEALQPAQVIAGWGQHAAKINRFGLSRPRKGAVGTWRPRAAEMVDLLGDRLLSLAVTKDGHPGHPLYLSTDLKPVPYPPRTP